MAPAIHCPATRAWPGHMAVRLAETPGLRGVGAWPPVTTVGAFPTG